MTREEVWESVAAYLRTEFGKLLEVRDVRRVRRVAGDAWAVTVILAAPSGDLHVGDVFVDEEGSLRPLLGASDVIAAVRNADDRKSAVPSDPIAAELAGLGDAEDDDFSMLDASDDLSARVASLVDSGDRTSLLRARELLPRLLSDQTQRGQSLLRMARVEQSLGEPKLALSYAEAAAREFGDRFALAALEDTAALALELLGKDAFSGSRIHALLEQCRMRLRPLPSLFDCRSLSELAPATREVLERAATLRTLGPSEILVVEGDPSENVFVVKSGLIGVYLEKPTGGSWLVRCCFPGWLLGESSVISGMAARCTATLRAERVSEIWTLAADVVKKAMAADPSFAERIAATKQIHRIDSFFSMHESMAQLDVQVRDEVLSCIQRLESFSEETILMPAGEVPSVGLLVARGEVALFPEGDGALPITMEPDTFFGVRDAIHQIPSPLTVVARAGATVAFFDAERLRALCARSPEHVVAVLERLG